MFSFLEFLANKKSYQVCLIAFSEMENFFADVYLFGCYVCDMKILIVFRWKQLHMLSLQMIFKFDH